MLNTHVFRVVDEVRRQVAAIELHAFNHFQRVFQALAFFNGDNAFFTHFFHRFRDDLTNMAIAIGRNSTDLSNRFAVGTGDRQGFDLLYGGSNRFVDTALQVHRVHASSNGFQTLVNDGLCQNSCGSGAVTRVVRGFGSHFLHHLGAHVLQLVFQLDFFRHRYTVFGHGRRTERLIQNHIAAFGTQRYFNGICQGVNTSHHALASFVAKYYVFSHDRLTFNSLIR